MTPWHKNSRFWRVGAWALALSWSLVPMAILGAPESVQVAMGVFGGVATVLFTGAAASNFRERDPRNGGGA